MKWRNKIDPSLRPYVERMIAESYLFKESYDYAEDKSKAQMWIAIGLMSKQLHDMDMKLNYIERAVQEIGRKDMTKTDFDQIKKDKQEVERIFKDILGGKLSQKRPVSMVFENPKAKSKNSNKKK
ncbi:hypothetical protein J4465_02905 [Candidatus Pacearchaeota archaeon]|nr:hypothetical protein [Candidatus Pacearchaeota archaeon]